LFFPINLSGKENPFRTLRWENELRARGK